MKKGLCGLILSMGVVVLMSGCATTGRVSAPVAKGLPGQPEAAATAELRHLTIAVVADAGSNEDGATVAGLLRQQVVDALAGKNLMVNDEHPDLRLNLNVQAAPFDQSGNYYVYDAELNASAQLASGQSKVLGKKNFKVRSERKLGSADALRSAAGKLSGDVALWSAEVLDPARFGLMANDVKVTMPWYQKKTDQAGYVREFVKTVSQMKGVVTCRVVEHDYADKAVIFRVVYFQDSFPAGVLNQLAQEDDLHIKPEK